MAFSEDLKFYLGYRSGPDEVEILADVARGRGWSEYDFFVEAGNRWNIPRAKVESDFSFYLTRQTIPPYVRAELRKTDYVYEPHRDVRLLLEFASRQVRRARRFFLRGRS